ncbi:DUF6461 domain-containing protein [Actinoallomurus sp. CA-150999]|uniref:DUF6461 domain-containing protein n=1 Tax=Actinoallomurus sp. CA-150999 TaxID=3239887 RepID=UPI003D8B0778
MTIKGDATPDPLAPFRWLEASGSRMGQIFCVAFFHRLGPGEVLRRFGAEESSGQLMKFGELNEAVGEFVEDTGGGFGGGYIGVLQAGDWSVALEPQGWQAVLSEPLVGLSRQCEVVAVGRHDYAEHGFAYAVDGQVVTGFTPHQPDFRWGTDPDRLNELMNEVELSLDPAAGQHTYTSSIAWAFAVAYEITGVVLTPDTLDEPMLVGLIGPYAPSVEDR